MMNGPSKVPTQWAVANAVPVGWMRQFRYLTQLFEKIRNVGGDVIECGLGEGNTFAMLAYLAGSEGKYPRELIGFDSFEGWPEPSPYDASPRNPQGGEWKVSEEMVRERLAASKILTEFPRLQISIVRGFLRDTLPNFPRRPIAFLHLDVDLYEGYRDGLQYLLPLVSEGGVILFDEYHEFPKKSEYGMGTIEKWPGCTKAVDDFFRNRPEKLQYHPETKKYFVVKEAK